MGKRPAASSAVVAAALKAKMAKKVSPIERMCDKVINSLRDIPGLPEGVGSLLGDVVPHSLAICKEERHAYQVGMVAAIETELLKWEQALDKAVAEAEASVAQLDRDREAGEASLVELDAKLAERREEAQEKKWALADAALAFRAGKEGFAEAEAKQRAGDAAIEEAAKKHAALGQVVSEVLCPLKEGTLEKERVPDAAAGLIPALQMYFEIEESLIPAIPTVFSKEPSARGPFDTMAAVQLEEQANKALADFSVGMKGSEAGKAERAAAVAKASEALCAAKDAQRGSAGAYEAAKALEEAAEAAVQDAKATLRQMQPERRVRVKAVGKAQLALKAFREGPLPAFGELRDRSNQPKEAPAEEATAEAATVEAPTVEAATAEADAEMAAEPAATADA